MCLGGAIERGRRGNAASIMIGEKAADLVLGTGPREVEETQTA